MLETIASTTGHTLERDRLTTNYITLDDDVKLCINLRFMLHIYKQMDVARHGVNSSHCSLK